MDIIGSSMGSFALFFWIVILGQYLLYIFAGTLFFFFLSTFSVFLAKRQCERITCSDFYRALTTTAGGRIVSGVFVTPHPVWRFKYNHLCISFPRIFSADVVLYYNDLGRGL